MKKLFAIALILACTFTASGQRKTYGVKSGILKTVTTTGEQKSYCTQWWDDYGNKDKATTEMDMGDFGKYTATILMVGEEMWAINMDGKAQKATARPSLNWTNLTAEDYKQFKIEDKGTEEYKGKTCHVYTYEQKQLLTKVKITVWIWEGLTLKQLIKKKTSESVTELVELKVGAKIPAGTFSVPAED